ncbi:MAG: aspartate--tRNA ligase, partial [Pyrinomonadaceae bacterium]
MLDLLGNLQRTHSCGSLREEHVGQTVVLMGWVARKRDFGVFTFIDLRDREGITQIVVSEDFAPEAHTKAKQARSEYVIAVKGEVVARSPETVNQKIPTGKIEVLAKEILILNDSKPLPFELEKVGSQNLASEELRLKYRYLDLRRPQLQRNLMMRAQAIKKIREYMDSLGFIEIETPILLKSTPEGARDFIVPSRIYRGKFFALPQSPQILKQICMIAGFDKYYQIARCFRDEDLRADRQPEFTQLDVEMSFVNQEMVYSVIEGVFRSVFRLIDVELPEKFPRMTYNEAIERFGTDKPDLRFSMELKDLTESFKTAENIASSPFASALQNGGMVKAITVKGKADYSRKQLDELQEFVKRYGASGLTWIKFLEETQSPLAKFFSPEKLTEFAEKAEAEKGDIVLIVAGKKSVVLPALGALRIEIAKRENLIDKNTYKPVLITEFPMFEYNEEEQRWEAAHHMFTWPQENYHATMEQDPGAVKGDLYDLVLNGFELASGSIRIHDPELQKKIFKIVGFSEAEAEKRFGFLVEAFKYGPPPHGGIAPGLDRLVMLMAGQTSIKEVIAFPKNTFAVSPMDECPSEVDQKQLDELHLIINYPNKQ